MQVSIQKDQIQWTSCLIYPYFGETILMEDHEGNWAMAIFTGEFCPFPGMPPFGIATRWVHIGAFGLPHVVTSCGYFIKDSDIFGDIEG